MDRREYIKEINELRHKIEDKSHSLKQLDILEKDLTNLFKIKPVSLLWFVAKAELMIKQNIDVNQIYEVLRYKGQPYYKYEGIQEYYETFCKLAKIENNIHKYNKYKNVLDRLNENTDIRKIDEMRKKYLEDDCLDNCIDLMWSYYENNDFVMYDVLRNYLCLIGKEDNTSEGEIFNNCDYLNLIMNSKENKGVIICASDKNKIEDYKILTKILTNIEKEVYYIDFPLIFDSEESINIIDTVEISFDNMIEREKTKVIKPVKVFLDNKLIGDNTSFILKEIIKKFSNKLALIMGSGETLDYLSQQDNIKKEFERLSPFVSDIFENNMAFGYCGSYIQYISNIYQMDVSDEINKKTEYDFSIIIPARNSSESLEYTLKTCLNQRYKGKYEVVVSDNSTDGNMEVYNLCKKLNSSKINYYKVPANLCLSKSFEYAYLRSRGEFIISLGSDDAILPWALETLKKCIDKYPNNYVFQWHRGFYAWPGFNYGQENQFVIPQKYNKDNVNEIIINRTEYLAQIAKDSGNMYELPLLYINSGFRRSYMNKIFEFTGRLWDGCSQDVYIGIINILINKSIVFMQYPLTIAGMTSSSVGYQCQRDIDKVNEVNKFIISNTICNKLGGYSTSVYERMIPTCNKDKGAVYSSFYRAIARGIINIDAITQLVSINKIMLEMINQIGFKEILYDKYINEYRYIAGMYGEGFLEWFDNNIYQKALSPKIVSTKISNEKCYKEEVRDNGARILDASKYNVKNVYEASLLFEKLTGL